ncbi:MAG TPA: glycosyltransferase [Burkholderiales bacterium]|jgi:hyaluronan synthase|nr:glycosyltransferase [Burkholderiales bacterium]
MNDIVRRAPFVVAASATPKSDGWDKLLIITIFGGILTLAYAALSTAIFDPLLRLAYHDDWFDLMVRPTVLWILMGIFLLTLRTVMWLRYRAFAPATADDAPRLTVIIPAYNEGRMVEKSIDSVAAADYPRDRLQIIVVDDGSRDDTWDWIERAVARQPQLITPIRFVHNRGKRAALAEGFRQATGDVVVTIDSDSVIERNTLLAMAGPFRNAKVGAVAGKVAVFNRRKGLLPRMLHVRFILAFDFLRSAQSTYGTVYCCPGALAGYRMSAVRQILEKWEHQTFMGVDCTYGEDRALTNCILQLGYDSVYQRNAVVHTLAPETYTKLCKMYLRWDRSYIREEIRFLSKVVWKRPLGSRLIAFVETMMNALRFPVTYVSLTLWIAFIIVEPAAMLRMMIAIGIASTFYMLYYLRSERSWDFIFGVLYAYFAFFGLMWIFPYAALTVRAKSWLTR